MIREDAVEAFNNRLRATLNDIGKMSPSQLDQVKSQGSRAEALLQNRDLVMFLHQFRFDVADQIANIVGHTADDNARRIAFANQLSGIDSFIASLQRAVYMKTRAVSQQEGGPLKAPDITKEVYNP